MQITDDYISRPNGLTSSEVIELLSRYDKKISRQRLYQLRCGFDQIKNNKKYFIKPQLRENIDWFKYYNNVLFNEQSIINFFMLTS